MSAPRIEDCHEISQLLGKAVQIAVEYNFDHSPIIQFWGPTPCVTEFNLPNRIVRIDYFSPYERAFAIRELEMLIEDIEVLKKTD